MNRVFGLLMISVFLMSCNSTGFLSNGGNDGKKSKSNGAGSNSEIGYRNGKFLPTVEELEILSSPEYSSMVNYDIDEALDAVENSFTEDLGIALVDLELENPKDAESAIDHALASFTTADIAALTQIQEGTNENYDPYFEFEKEYGYSISESERFNIVHFPDIVGSSKGPSALRLQDEFTTDSRYSSEFSEDNFARNGMPTDFENHFIDTATNGYGGQRAVDDWNADNGENKNHQMVYGEVNGTQYFNIEAKSGINEISRGFGTNGSQTWAWNKVPNPDGPSFLYKTIYNANGQEIARVVEAYGRYGKKRNMTNCGSGFVLKDDGTCVKDEAEVIEPVCETETVEYTSEDGSSSSSSSTSTCSY